MSGSSYLSNISSLLVFATATVVLASRQSSITSSPAYLNPPPEAIEHFTFGFSESVADSLWLRWIQDGDACQTYAGVSGASASTAIPPRAPDMLVPRHRVCDRSWSFKMLDAVTRVAPRFRMPYVSGTMTLAVLVEDYVGSTVLFDRAIENYPNDWEILYRAGYHYLYDVQDLEKAAKVLNQAADHGAPYWVRFLAARIYTKAGRAELGIATLENYLKTLDREDKRIEVRTRIEEFRKQLGRSPSAEP